MGGSETSSGDSGDQRPDVDEGKIRPQGGGEAETTRFGMEEGENSDIPATGEGAAADDAGTPE